MNDNEKGVSKQFDYALRLRDAGDLAGARRALESLIEQLTPADVRLLPHSHMQIGSICRRVGDLTKCEFHFRSAVEVAPTLELASLGLFHALFDQGRLDEALQEMLRLLRLRDSELYAELLNDGFGAEFSNERQELVTEARRLLRRHRQN